MSVFNIGGFLFTGGRAVVLTAQDAKGEICIGKTWEKAQESVR